MKRDFLKIGDLSLAELREVLSLARVLKDEPKGKRTGALAGSVKRADGMASLVVSSDGASVITAEYRHGVERWARWVFERHDFPLNTSGVWHRLNDGQIMPGSGPRRSSARFSGSFSRPMAWLALAQACGLGHTLVDLGAGNCAKAARLFGVLRPSRYVAVDISVEFLRHSLQALQVQHPQLPMLGVGMDFSTSLRLPAQAGGGTRLMFYPGSSIGNFTPEAAERFLRRVRAAAPQGALLIGVDLLKPPELLQRAYDDALGVTAAFNLNLLRHVNRLLGSDFDVAQWRHAALFDAARSRVEMHLEARADLQVRWPQASVRWRAGERVLTEIACKYTVEGFDALLRRAGYAHTRCWTDARCWFAVFVAR